ncbi:MAG: DUF2202 domain-containing protein [Acidobacteria bacterium]|nr:DUF2202 domain-containing protein [Acidobacteriota bacterium]
MVEIETGENKTMKYAKTILVLCLFVAATVSAQAQSGRGMRNGPRYNSGICPRISSSTPSQPLDVEETAKLLLMREEEKLAMDVYQALYQKWGIRIFNNIAASEKRHFDAIGNLIIRYELSDPAKPAAGEFTDPDLQKMYDDLVAQGMKSLVEAFQVGVAIEEADIEDLRAAISITDNNDVLTVYGNLLNGSLNHLDAFNSQLDARNNN